MARFRVYATVVGSKYLGEFDAEDEAAAKQMALASDEAGILLCHQCSHECEDPEVDVDNITVERVSPRKRDSSVKT